MRFFMINKQSDYDNFDCFDDDDNDDFEDDDDDNDDDDYFEARQRSGAETW